MKHFIFTSILPDDGEQHTNVETNKTMYKEELYVYVYHVLVHTSFLKGPCTRFEVEYM